RRARALPLASRGARPAPTRRDRGAHPRHSRQAAARPHRAAEGRSRLGSRRAARGCADRAVRPLTMLRAATRGSPLARLQTELVATELGVDVEAVVVETTGDRNVDVAIWAMGGQGVFVTEVQAAVLDGRADIAVHSAKDLPSSPTDGLVIAAVPGRGDPRDALVG